MTSSTRRGFLVASASMAGGLLVLGLAGCGGGDGGTKAQRRLAIDVARLLPPDAAEIGKRWLREAPDQETGALVAAIFSGPGWEDLGPGTDPSSVAAWLARQIATEHERGATETLLRWRLSPTELRLCALAAREA